MQPARHPARRQPPARAGFTLIELMVVMVVVAILIGLLIPVVSSSMNRAREAQVVVEMSKFDAALVGFRSKFGVEVPSFIVLYETAADWAADNPRGLVPEVSHRTSRAFIRQAWPDFDFDYTNGTTNGAVTAGAMDINGNGDSDDVLFLNGAECLAFFLGGICETDIVANDANNTVKTGATIGDPITWWNPLGFSANPQNPFARGGTRVRPFAEFNAGPNGRFRDFFESVATGDPTLDEDEEMPEYFDPLPGQLRPYLYLSSYSGRGYQPDGPDGTPGDPAGTAAEIIEYADNDLPGTVEQGMEDPYYSAVPPPPAPPTAHNPQSYQIISPGSTDYEYGAGGEYNGEASINTTERDNITNFKKGRLN